MSDWPTMPQGDEGMPPGVSVRDIPGERPRHYHDTPTIREMLDAAEQSRAVNAPALVAALRTACDALEWYESGHGPESRLSDNGEHAQQALESITRSLWATSPRELWFETPALESLGGGGLGQGENAPPKEATDNDGSSATRETKL